MSDLITKLVTKPIPSLADAAMLAGSFELVSRGYGGGYDKHTPMVLVPDRNCCVPYLCIPEGFFAIGTSYGKYEGIWPPGFTPAAPWQQVSHLVTKQYVVFDTPVKECPTADNVMVQIDVSVVFHVKETEEDVKNFVYKLGPERLEQMLRAYQEEAVRNMARQKKYTNIYDLMDTEELVLPKQPEPDSNVVGELEAEPIFMPGQDKTAIAMANQGARPGPSPSHGHGGPQDDISEQLENTKREMNTRLSPYGVNVYSVTITNVHLPPDFRKQMEEATTFDSRNIRAAAEQKFNLLKIENNEKRNQAQQKLNEEKQEAKSKNEQRVANETKITQVYQAGTNALIADIVEKMKADAREIRAKSDLAVAKLQKAKDEELSAIEAEGAAEVKRIQTEMQGFLTTVRAEAQLAVAKHDAEALDVQAKAEAVAATKLRAKREYETKKQQLEVLRKLARNKQLTLSGTNKDSVIAQLVAAKNTSISLGVNV